MEPKEEDIPEAILKKFRFCKLPKNHYRALRSDIQETGIDISDWIEDPKSKLGGRGLFLYGDYGRGKSSIAAIVVKLLIHRGVFPLWIEYGDIPMYVKENTLFNANQTVLDRAKEVEFLVVNEFNPRKYSKAFPVDALDYLIRSRVGDGLTTIITSNTCPSKLVKDKDVGPMCESLVAISREAFDSVLVSGKDLRKK